MATLSQFEINFEKWAEEFADIKKIERDVTDMFGRAVQDKEYDYKNRLMARSGVFGLRKRIFALNTACSRLTANIPTKTGDWREDGTYEVACDELRWIARKSTDILTTLNVFEAALNA